MNLASILFGLMKKAGHGMAVRAGYYVEDGFISSHNHEFIADSTFLAAYERGLQSGHGVNPGHRWRVHTALWAAQVASMLEGDFVECGVNTGFMSSAIMHYLSWNQHNRRFYLLDTFDGPVGGWFCEEECLQGKVELADQARSRGSYCTDVARIRMNFSEWDRVHIIQGIVPQTLGQVDSEFIAYLHLDMNQAYPEVKAAEFFWPRLVDGAVILLDDYAYYGYHAQKKAMDEFARSVGVPVLSLPTGQGLMVRPPRGRKSLSGEATHL
jgi:hypothetical protein